MNEEGYIPVAFIASFTRIKQLSENIFEIMEAISLIEELELKGDMVKNKLNIFLTKSTIK